MKNAKKKQEIFNTFIERYQEGMKYRSVRDTIFMMPEMPVLRIINKELAIKTPAGIWHSIYDGKDWALPEKAYEYVGKTVKGLADKSSFKLKGNPFWNDGKIKMKYGDKEYKRFVIFNGNKWAEIVEEKKPLFTTDEAEIYNDGKGVEIFEGDKTWFIDKTDLTKYTPSHCSGKAKDTFIYTATEQAADDYIKLETLRREAGLKVGDRVVTNGLKCWSTMSVGWFRSIDNNIRAIEAFFVWKGVPCFAMDKNTLYYSLQSYIDKKKEQEQKGINTHPIIEDALNNLRTAIKETYEKDF